MIIEESSINGLSFIEATNSVGMKVVISSFGASLYELSIDGVAMTSSEMDKTIWATSPSFSGKTVGRIAGRIKDGLLTYKGKTYQLDKNERGKNCHHGGDGLFAFSNYSMSHHFEDNALCVDCVKTDDKSKFPGTVTLRVRYVIPENDTYVRIEHTTVASEDTPVNFTSHTYFSLGEDCLDDMILTINSDEVEGYDDELIAAGLRPVPSYLDWREGKPFKSCLEAEELQAESLQGLDHAFKLVGKPQMSLAGKRYKMELVTSLPAVHVYSFNFPNESVMMTNGLLGRKHGSLAVEPMYLPGDYEAMTAKKDEPKTNYIEYRISKIG